MGKRLIQQARGKGGPRYRAPSFRYQGVVKYPPLAAETLVGTVKELLHCAGHSSPLTRVRFASGTESLLVAPEGLRVGDLIQCGEDAPLTPGNMLPLSKIPEGTLIYNIESNPGDGGKFVRASGTAARVLSTHKGRVLVSLPSKKEKDFHPNCRATVGICAGGGRLDKPLMRAGTALHKYKAKNKLWPQSGGQKMNAVDHPFGCKRSSRKGMPHIAPANAPPGRKVGKIRPKQVGRKSTKSVKERIPISRISPRRASADGAHRVHPSCAC